MINDWADKFIKQYQGLSDETIAALIPWLESMLEIAKQEQERRKRL